MKNILTLLFFITALCVQTSYSQDNSSSYRTAIGVKIYPGTITLKQGVNGGNYVEGQAAFFNKGFRLTALYEFHNDINGAKGLRWYYGGGPHLGFSIPSTTTEVLCWEWMVFWDLITNYQGHH